ncbi:MAG: hypothetical protein LQ340_006243 [Diploschistes diacapsis]|nr:MAG: hypothetical protein LQ340_006243 [Diploschistes diacapsis]
MEMPERVAFGDNGEEAEAESASDDKGEEVEEEEETRRRPSGPVFSRRRARMRKQSLAHENPLGEPGFVRIAGLKADAASLECARRGAARRIYLGEMALEAGGMVSWVRCVDSK